MDIGNGAVSRVFGGAMVAAATVLAGAGIALASNAVAEGSYSGTYKQRPTDTISFKVSANGKRVIDIAVSTPFHCGGGCGGVQSPSGGTARISKHGTFKATLPLQTPGTHPSTFGHDMVTGKFLKNGQAKGTVSSHFDKSPSSDETVDWTATG